VTTNKSHKSIAPTNGYVHVEGAVEHQNAFRLFTLSARSEHSLTHWIQDLKKYLQKHDHLSLNDLSYTLTSRRSNFQWRSSIVAQDVKSLVQKLSAKEHAPAKTPFQVGNVFIFSGQGTQYWRMGYELLSTKSEFSRSIQLSDQYLQSLGAPWSLVEELCRDEGSSKLNDSKYGQPASSAIQVALVDLLKSWNVLPLAVIGHSSGEIAAAYSAGSINHRTAIQASYERSFLAEAAREQSLQHGAMMAVGVGEDEVREYISQLTSSQVVVACINSPSSTTVSGDAPAVKELQELLKSKGIFARLLKVDMAYHSHHMKRVSKNYLDRLEGLQSGSTSADIRYFSTVSGIEKSDGFGASYWVENLVSPVRFDGAFQALVREMGQIPLNLIEIGAHKALGGPIRQSLAKQQAGGLLYRYIPTLVRGEDSCMSLMETASNLFKTGGDLHVDVAASLGISDLSPTVIRNLPPYHWNHNTTHWNEPRLSKDYRFRRHPHHDFLGLRTTTSPDSEPSWRIILTLDSLPWLKDHIVDSFVVFPGSGYMAMAIEGLKQLNQDQHPNSTTTGYQLKNISFKRTLTLSNDTAGVEVILTLRHSGSSGYDFTVSSLSEQGKWQEHCDGKISATFEAALDEVEQTREIDLRLKTHADSLKTAESSCVELVEQAELYHKLASAGNQYGPTFAVVKEAHLAKSKSLSTIIIPNIAAIMPSQWQQPHVIHPTTFDALLHTCVLLFSRVSSYGSVMPVFIGDVFISADILNEPGRHLQVVCDLKTTFASSSNFDIAAFQENSGHEFIPVLTISDGEVRVVGASQETSKARSDNIFKMQWGLDMSSVKAEALESVVIPLQSDEIGVTPAEKTVALVSPEFRIKGLPISSI
jgi:acyl transferase domain-containing protein